jgi:hypothetical protein
MPHVEQIEHFLQLLVCLSRATLLWRLSSSRLYRSFPYFASFAGLDFLVTSATVLLPYSSVLYARIYEYSSIAYIVAELLVATELFAHVTRANRGLKYLTRRALRVAILCAVIAIITSVLVTYRTWGDPRFECAVFVYMEASRSLAVGTVIYVLLALRSFRSEKVELSRNSKIITTTFTLVLFLNSAETTILAAFGLYTSIVNTWFGVFLCTVQLGCNAICILGLREEPQALRKSESTSPEVFAAFRDMDEVISAMARVTRERPLWAIIRSRMHVRARAGGAQNE